MIKAVRHIPNFIDRDEPSERCEVENTTQLLDIDWVRSYTRWEEFHNFCQSRDGKYLMIENKDGTWWWVVARVEGELTLTTARMNDG